MRVECGLVAIDLVEHYFRVVVQGKQGFKLNGTGLVLEGARSVRHQQGQKLVPTSGRDFDGGHESKLWHAGISNPPFACASGRHKARGKALRQAAAGWPNRRP